jgi:hypothetical protein
MRASIERLSTAAWQSPRRWRAFADAVALALGINVWVSILLLPGAFAGAWRSASAIVLAFLALAVLVFGVARRSEVVLLLGFPAALLLPVAVAPEMAQVHVYGPVRFTIVAIGLVGYVMGASVFTSFHEPDAPLSVRPLSSAAQPTPIRWQRRFRVYRALAVLSAVFPIMLVYAINFDTEASEFLHNNYPGRVRPFTTLLNIGALGVWVLLYFYFFLGVLQPHRTGDRDLVTELTRLRREAKRARPRASFYIGVVVALGFMAVLLASRYM